jgi:hypothetical protein
MKGALFGAHNNESSLACRRSSSRYLLEPVAINIGRPRFPLSPERSAALSPSR